MADFLYVVVGFGLFWGVVPALIPSLISTQFG